MITFSLTQKTWKMIGNVHGINDKTSPLSCSQDILLHAIYSARALPRNFGKMKFFKKSEKNNITRPSLNELATKNPNSAGFHETLSGSKAPKAPTVIRYYKLKMDNS